MKQNGVSNDSLRRSRARASAFAKAFGCLVLLITSVGLPEGAHADTMSGYARTDWGYDNKAYCCEDAIALAQDEAARACENAGGFADFRRSSARGRCDWESARGRDGRRIYRCEANSSVSCR